MGSNEDGASGGAQRLWWRDEVVASEQKREQAARARATSPSVTILASEPVSAEATETAKPSILHAPVAEADEFDTLWEELEAEAVRRAAGERVGATQAQHAGIFAALTVPLTLGAIVRRDRAAALRNVRAFGILFGVMAAMIISIAVIVMVFGRRFPGGMVGGLSVSLSNVFTQWQLYRAAQKRFAEWESRDDWRVSVGQNGLTFVTPWTNEGKEEMVLWSGIHDIKVVTPPGRAKVKERFFCVERRDGLGFDGKPILPQPEDALTKAEKRRLAWRRFCHLDKTRPPKLSPPMLIPEIALPISADALVARIGVYDAGRVEEKRNQTTVKSR